MVLDHVPQSAGLLVEAPALLDADALRHRDLHVVNVPPVPHRLKNPVGEAEDQYVLHGLLAQIVVYAIDIVLRKDGVDHPVKVARRFQVPPERLLDYDARPARVGAVGPRVAAAAELADDRRVRAGRHRQLIEMVPGYAALALQMFQPLRQPLVARSLVVLTRHVEETTRKALPQGRLDWATGELADRGLRVLSKIIVVPFVPREADDRALRRQLLVRR